MNDSENILNRDEKSKDSKDESPRVVFRLCRGRVSLSASSKFVGDREMGGGRVRKKNRGYRFEDEMRKRTKGVQRGTWGILLPRGKTGHAG